MKKNKSSSKKTLFPANGGHFLKGSFLSEMNFPKKNLGTFFKKYDSTKKTRSEKVRLNAVEALFLTKFSEFLNSFKFICSKEYFRFYFQ